MHVVVGGVRQVLESERLVYVVPFAGLYFVRVLENVLFHLFCLSEPFLALQVINLSGFQDYNTSVSGDFPVKKQDKMCICRI